VTIVDADSIPDGHRFRIEFSAPPESIRATQYVLIDSTTGETCFEHGADFEATGTGTVGCGLLPLITTIPNTRVWTDSTGFTATSTTTMKLRVAYNSVQDVNLERPRLSRGSAHRVRRRRARHLDRRRRSPGQAGQVPRVRGDRQRATSSSTSCSATTTQPDDRPEHGDRIDA
jgi:hypothetical protein